MKILERAPAGCGQMLLALDFLLNDTQEIVIASESPSELEQWRKQIFSGFIARRTIAYLQPNQDGVAVLRDMSQTKTLLNGQTTIYICHDFSCQNPLTNHGEIKAVFDTMKATDSSS